MSMFSDSSLGNFIRGGQTTLHYCRMVTQVIKKFTGASILIAFITFCIILYSTTSYQEKRFAWELSIAWFHNDLFRDGKTEVDYHRLDEIKVKTTAEWLVEAGAITRKNEIKAKSYRALLYTFIAWIILLGIMARFVFKTGKSQKKDEFLRGSLLVDTKTLKKRIRDFIIENREKWGTFEFGGMKLPLKFEVQHFLVVGEPGTGKSVLIKDALKSVRKNKQRAFIYDRSGDFVVNFYRPGKDIILNPFDERAAEWDLFKECKQPHEFDTLATSFIPEAKSNDPFWTNAPRILFSALAHKESERRSPSLKRLIDNILHLSLEEMMDVCAGTDAAAILSKGGEKMAISVRGVLVSYVRSLKYLKESNNGFSIKDWVRDDKGDSWIFITSNKSIHEVCKPLITAWIDTATDAILSLPPSFERRIWGVVDELVTLNKLPSIRDTPAEVRKHGGAFIYGFQNFPQLVDIYGREGAAALAGSCSTLAIFRSSEDTFAAWGSRQLGKAEVIETNEALSFGSNEIRDGVNLGKSRRERPIVMDSELQNLPDLHCFIRLGRGLPVAYHVQQFKKLPEVAEGFIERDYQSDNKVVDIDLDTVDCDVEGGEDGGGDTNTYKPVESKNDEIIEEDSSYIGDQFATPHEYKNTKHIADEKTSWSVNTSLKIEKPIKAKKRKYIDNLEEEKEDKTPNKGLMAFKKKKKKGSDNNDDESESRGISVDDELSSDNNVTNEGDTDNTTDFGSGTQDEMEL